MPEIETAGYKKFWEMKQLIGHNPDGSRRVAEGFRDMVSGEFHTSEKGFDGEPPVLLSGEKDPVISDNFSRNYDKIKWDREGIHAAKKCEL